MQAAEADHGDGSSGKLEFGVVGRDPRVVDDDVIGAGASDGDDGGGEVEVDGLAAAGIEDETGHGEGSVADNRAAADLASGIAAGGRGEVV